LRRWAGPGRGFPSGGTVTVFPCLAPNLHLSSPSHLHRCSSCDAQLNFSLGNLADPERIKDDLCRPPAEALRSPHLSHGETLLGVTAGSTMTGSSPPSQPLFSFRLREAPPIRTHGAGIVRWVMWIWIALASLSQCDTWILRTGTLLIDAEINQAEFSSCPNQAEASSLNS